MNRIFVYIINIMIFTCFPIPLYANNSLKCLEHMPHRNEGLFDMVIRIENISGNQMREFSKKVLTINPYLGGNIDKAWLTLGRKVKWPPCHSYKKIDIGLLLSDGDISKERINLIKDKIAFSLKEIIMQPNIKVISVPKQSFVKTNPDIVVKFVLVANESETDACGNCAVLYNYNKNYKQGGKSDLYEFCDWVISHKGGRLGGRLFVSPMFSNDNGKLGQLIWDKIKNEGYDCTKRGSTSNATRDTIISWINKNYIYTKKNNNLAWSIEFHTDVDSSVQKSACIKVKTVWEHRNSRYKHLVDVLNNPVHL